MEKHILEYEKPFEFEAGGVLDKIQIAYHTPDGRERPREGEKVIWICHALTADSDPQDWWPELVGPGKFFDTDRYFIACVNMLGSCYGTSGPSSLNPKTGRPYFFDFPKVTVRDIARTINIVREHLGISKIDFIVGSSIGGFQALELCIMYPDLIRNAAFIATLGRVTPWLTGFEESQRMALEADPTFRECKDLDGGKAGMKCARTIALLSYRCEDGYNRKQAEQSDDTIFADRAASYQRYQGEKFAKRFDAYSYYSLSYSVDSDNVGRGRGGLARAYGMISCPSKVVAIDSDLIFPPYEMEEMAKMIPEAGYSVITSHYGHDGFLLENEQIMKELAPILESL
jgi:homoserine O-acetyltransferase